MIVIVALASIFVLGRYLQTVVENPTRSECIVGYRLDWSHVEGDRDDVRYTFGEWPRGKERVAALAGTSITYEGDSLYLQFKSDCRRKQEMAERVIAFWQQLEPNLPEFERIPDPIVPSTKTIDHRGPYWSDGQTR